MLENYRNAYGSSCVFKDFRIKLVFCFLANVFRKRYEKDGEKAISGKKIAITLKIQETLQIRLQLHMLCD